MPAHRRLAALPALLLLFVLACSPGDVGGQGGGNRIVTPVPATRQPSAPAAPATPAAQGTPTTSTTSTAAHLRGQGLSSAELYTAYRAILDTYVDPVDDAQLIKAARDTLQQGLKDQVALPLATLPLQLAPPPTSGDPDKDWRSFGDAYDSLVGKLPDWAAQAHPDWLVLRGMADSLHDGHTSFLTPDEARRRNETSFAGIGVSLSRPQDNQPPLIAEIFPNSPAAGSGLKRGDRIVTVDGHDVSGKSVGEIAEMIRGQSGTQVKVQVRRLNQDQPLEFTLRRAQVQLEAVIGRQVPNAPIGYLRIRNFNDPSSADGVLGILDQGQRRGIRGWVLDLRNNPGGSLQAVLGAAAGFVDADHTLIGYQIDRQRHQSALQTQSLDLLNGAALVVLVDHDSASGAEILAAALQEAKIGTIVGTKTAGNVGVATQITLPDSSVLSVTEERFVSPSGAQLDGAGVTPDVPVDMTDEDLENDRDPQLNKALQLVVQKVTGQPASGGG